MKFFLAVATFLSFQFAFSQATNDELFKNLDSLSENRDAIVHEKIHVIDRHRIILGRVRGEAQYSILDSLYNEYKSFIYDSAFFYALKLQQLAHRLHDPVKIVNAKMKVGFALASSGLLNEALDTLRTIRVAGLSKTQKMNYYYLLVRTCYDLSDFAQNSFYEKKYTQMAEVYADSAIALFPNHVAEYLIVKGLRSLHQSRIEEARAYYEDLVSNYRLTDHQFAIAASTLSYIYSSLGDMPHAKEMLVRAAIADTKSSTKEAIALVKLADLLYHEGNAEKAYEYIKLAMEDANFYGARYRKMQVASIFPVIEAERFSRLENKRKMLLLYSLLITVSVVTLIVVSYTIIKQYRKLQKTEQALSMANDQLKESNKIKEEYLWYYFNATADYIGKLDALRATIELKVISKKVDELRFIAFNINIKRERSELFYNFDKIFLKLFPNFVHEFNAMLSDGNKVVVKDGQLLNVEMRIFALMRLGIHDHEKIAKILGYSLTTVYTYKTRVKSRAIVASEEFDNRILSIPAL